MWIHINTWSVWGRGPDLSVAPVFGAGPNVNKHHLRPLHLRPAYRWSAKEGLQQGPFSFSPVRNGPMDDDLIN